MKNIITILALVMGPAVGFAQTPSPAASPSADANAAHAEMHEKMAKAHQDAAACLKSGKTMKECGEAFHAACKDTGAPGMCADHAKGMMHGHHGGKKKAR